jgi:hypothetical protein
MMLTWADVLRAVRGELAEDPEHVIYANPVDWATLCRAADVPRGTVPPPPIRLNPIVPPGQVVRLRLDAYEREMQKRGLTP